jgi:hypothetical protein
MREIGKHNYEEYFFDYHEGLLNDEQKSLVEAFLLKYPEHQEEFDAYGESVLKAPTVQFNWKQSLKKSDTDLSPIEERLIAVAEGLEEESTLDPLFKEDSKLKHELRLIQRLKLQAPVREFPYKTELKATLGGVPRFIENQLPLLEAKYSLRPNEGETFQDKGALKKESSGILIFLNRAARVAAAAVVLIALAWFAMPDDEPAAILGNKINNTESFRRFAELDLGNEQVNDNSREVIKASNSYSKPENEILPNNYDVVRVESITKINKRSIRPIEQELVARVADPKLKDRRGTLPEVQQEKVFAMAKPTERAVNQPKEISLAEFAKRKIGKSLINKSNPEEGLALAVLDKAVEKLDERSDRELDLELNKTENNRTGFELSIGKLKIKR